MTMPMNPTLPRGALFYPFHLCAPRTLDALLARYHAIHFRDYMALRLTPLMGTMAYQDRMGDEHPSLVESGRLVQGYPVSGPLDPSAIAAVDRDLGNRHWRTLFHNALRNDRRFQRGLFDLTHAMQIGQNLVPGPAALLRLMEPGRTDRPYSVAIVQTLAKPVLSLEEAYEFEYGLALLKTAAAQIYTIRLAQNYNLSAVTDSRSHFTLLNHTLEHEGVTLNNEYVDMAGEHPLYFSPDEMTV